MTTQAICVSSIAIPTMIPMPLSRPAETIYLPEMFDRDGNYVPEMTFKDMTLGAMINAITAGEFPKLVSITAVDKAAGRVWDASEEIALEVVAQAFDYYGFIPASIREFLEDALGVNTLRSMEREAA